MLLYEDSLEDRLTKALKVSAQLERDNGLKRHMSLEKQLEYLSMYANYDDPNNTRCFLRYDFAPLSFSFVMYVKAAPGKGMTVMDYPARIFEELDGYNYWFSGGLIFHGKHDNGGDGGAPTFSVNLTTVDGWGIHT